MAKVVTSRSLGNIQVLLLLAMCDDLNGADAVGANETVWQNVGTAVRMAFGIVRVLGLLAEPELT
jgi:hypothetical protein